MKRTKNINRSTFRKSWRLAPIALGISSFFMLSGCDKVDETVTLYQNADDCSKSNPSISDQCKIAYETALQEAAKTAPKYATREDCIAEFGEGQCTPAPAQAGIAPASAQTEAQPQQSGGFWMPLMAGYMMGRLMGGGAYNQQPLFSPRAGTSPANGQFVDASGKSYGSATTGRTMNVPPSAMAPKPATTSTITRGGFGERVAQQNRLQRSALASQPRTRSFGG